MSIDIRLNEDFLRHYKTRALRKRLGADAVLSLQALWIWAAVYRTEGILYRMDDTKIENAAEWDGQEGKFISALVELEWLDKLEDGTYALHQWTEHQPWAADFANRSDKARLSSMAKNYPDIYEELTAQGYTGIDSASYAELTAEYNRRGILRHSSAFQRIASESLAPTPTPSPAPAPSPVPVPSTTPTPNPSRTPEPESVPERTQKKTRRAVAKAPASSLSSSSSREKSATEILSQNPQAASTAQAESATKIEYTARAESKDSMDKPEKILVQDEGPSLQAKATVEDAETLNPQAEQELSAGRNTFADSTEATLMGIMTRWNLQLAHLGFPQVLRPTLRRENAFKARTLDAKERIYLAWWVALFDKIAASDFMRESARQKANWLTLDWVLKEQNMMKILEGKYDSERPVTAEIHNKTFRTKRVDNATQRTEATQDTTVQSTPAGGIPEDSQHWMSEMRQILRKQPIRNDTVAAKCSDAVMEAKYVDALPEEIEREVPAENNANVEDTGYTAGYTVSYTAEELADYYAMLDEEKQEAQESAFEDDFSFEGSPEDMPDDAMSEEEYESYMESCMQELEEYKRAKEEYEASEASMRGDDDYYVA